MSIFERIKTRWRIKRQARRAWWLEPILRKHETADEFMRQQIAAGFLAQQREIDQMHQDVQSVQVNQSLSFWDVDKRLTELFPNLHAHLKSVQEQNRQLMDELKEVKAELEGIRSRYHWVEERYHEVTKTGVVPREFNFQKRQ